MIGDAIDAGLPKSAHMANAQAKICARAIYALMQGQAPDQAQKFANTCYSFVDDRQAMHISTLYHYDAAKKSMQAQADGFLSARLSTDEGAAADAWALQIWSDVLA